MPFGLLSSGSKDSVEELQSAVAQLHAEDLDRVDDDYGVQPERTG
jgi:hypothetical protein